MLYLTGGGGQRILCTLFRAEMVLFTKTVAWRHSRAQQKLSGMKEKQRENMKNNNEQMTNIDKVHSFCVKKQKSSAKYGHSNL